jgi:hypothetical protein
MNYRYDIIIISNLPSQKIQNQISKRTTAV